MLKLRPSNTRGVTQTNWLDSRHTFSFDQYYDPNYQRFHTLRVINQDIVAPSMGFAAHPHKDMEIITYVLKGVVAHQDSLGNKTIIHPGEIQRMSAGTGVTHSEYNNSKTDILELLQIWIFPEQKGLTPSYQQIKFAEKQTGLQLLVSPDGAEGSMIIHQQAKIFRGYLLKDQTFELPILTPKNLWLQMINGQLLLNHQLINPGDGMEITGESLLKIKANEIAEFLLFEV